MDFQAIRKEYENSGLNESDLLTDPIEEFRKWMDLAQESSPGRWFETNAMTLSTSDPDGSVTSRVVLLKEIRSEGFVFFTNYQSKKGQQISANPKVSLAFHWPYLGRQVRIEGTVTRTTREVSESYFHSRPRGAQIGAAISGQSTRVDSREELERLSEQLETELDGQPVPCPEHWGGFLVSPTKVEFWQGRLDRLHDRIEFRKENGENCGWGISRLAP